MPHFRLLLIASLLLISCKTTILSCKTTKPTPEPTPASVPEGIAVPTQEALDKARERAGWNVIHLNGVPTIVRWSDGDSFRFKSGEFDDNGVRLTRFNTLESYGPVHRWGDWTPLELFQIAKRSRYVASEKEWVCTTDGSRDGYNRVLVDCPDAAEHMVREGHAHAFTMDTAADPKLLKIQREAQKKGVGIWEKGVPGRIITSLHSYAEEYAKERGIAYNRSIEMKSGASVLLEHNEVYDTCQEVCVGPKDDPVCMIYVPFEIRYRGKPDCLRVPKRKKSEEAAPKGTPAGKAPSEGAAVPAAD